MNTEKQQQQISELKLWVARMAEIQRVRKLTDKQMVKEYPDLGSTKTWTDRLLGGLWSELKLDRWILIARRVNTILDGFTPDETFYPTMPFAAEMDARLLQLELQTNDRRILVCLAPTGTGKSAFTRWAVLRPGTRRACLRLRPTKRNKFLHIYREIGRACGTDITTSNVSAAEDAVITLLQSSPRTLFLDQAHEGGVVMMHILRALVDETPSRFVYLAYNTAYRNVLNGSTDAMTEAKAFIGRCIKPAFDLYKAGTRLEDVKFFLQRDAGLDKNAAESISPCILPVLQRHTNLRLLEDAIVEAREASKNDEPEPDHIISEVCRLSGENEKDVRKLVPADN